jgi:hypothetical protein
MVFEIAIMIVKYFLFENIYIYKKKKAKSSLYILEKVEGNDGNRFIACKREEKYHHRRVSLPDFHLGAKSPQTLKGLFTQEK